MLQHLRASMCGSSGRCVQVDKILPSRFALQSADQLKGNSPLKVAFHGENDKGNSKAQLTIQFALHGEVDKGNSKAPHHSICPSRKA